MEQEIFLSGYCRCLDGSRMVELITEDGKLLEIELPSFLYANELTAYLGFPKSGFFSADYVPVIPWLFLFFFGYFLYKIFERYGWLKALSFVSVKPLEFVGRHALPIYVLHQPVIYGALYLIFKVI